MLGVAVLGRPVAVRGERDLGDAEAVRCRAAVLQDANPGRAKLDHLAAVLADNRDAVHAVSLPLPSVAEPIVSDDSLHKRKLSQE